MAIRTICMGLGGRGRGWVRDVMRSEVVEFAGMVDPDAERMAKAAEDLDVPPEEQFSGLDDACDKAKPQAAVIVTPNVLHDEHIDACLDRGLHVLAEKPFVMKRDNGEAIIEKARRKGLVAMAVQNYRYSGPIGEMRRMVQEDELGEPTSCLVHFSRMRPIRGMPYALLYNQGIHHLDSMRYIFGDARTVYARSWNPNYHDCDAHTSCEAIFEMVNGVVINYSANYSTHGPNQPYGGVWRVECARGTIHLSPTEKEGELWVSREKSELEPVRFAAPAVGANGQLLVDLARAVHEGITPPTHAKDNLKSLAMIWAIVESSQTNRVVNVRA